MDEKAESVVRHVVVVLSKADNKPVVGYGPYSDILEARAMATRVNGYYVPIFDFQAPPFAAGTKATDENKEKVKRLLRKVSNG